MKKDKYVSEIFKRLIIIVIVLGLFASIAVFANNAKVKSIKIQFSNKQEITVLTAKTKVADILEENHIILLPEEFVVPSIEQEIDLTKVIKISSNKEEIKEIQVAEEIIFVSAEEIIDAYLNINEKIITIKENIPFETITKNVAASSNNTVNKILQYGKNGIKEVKYKVRYQNDVEIERIELESKVVKEPVNKIVQVTEKQVTSRSGVRTATAGNYGTFKVTAYCACVRCCGKTNGVTASGTHATAGRTIATSSQFSFGTQVKINGHIYTVEDRGGAIQGNRIDIYMDSHSEALKWGVRYLEVEVL